MADTISVKLAGLSQRDSNEVFKPKDMMVVTLNLRIDSSVKKKKAERFIKVPGLRQNNPRSNPNYGAETRKC